jgi:hypothetical protein
MSIKKVQEFETRVLNSINVHLKKFEVGIGGARVRMNTTAEKENKDERARETVMVRGKGNERPVEEEGSHPTGGGWHPGQKKDDALGVSVTVWSHGG